MSVVPVSYTHLDVYKRQGQYFDIKIDYVDSTEEEFNQRMNDYKQTLTQQFEESHRLETCLLYTSRCV